MGRFEERVVLVTGSSSGIGEATAQAFGAEGAKVVVNSATSVDAGQKVAAALPDGHYVQGDIAAPGAPEALVAAAVERYGRLDVLVNNAGITRVIAHHDLDALTEDVWRDILEVNLLGTFRMTMAALPHLRAAGDAAVVNVSSIAGVRPTGSSIPYAVSKAALNHLTALLGNVTGPEVRINAVAPGLVRTPWTAGWGPLHDAMDQRVPAGRSGEPDDVAAVIVDLAASRYVTGQVVLVDGGMSLR
jgi:ketoreductase RED2